MLWGGVTSPPMEWSPWVQHGKAAYVAMAHRQAEAPSYQRSVSPSTMPRRSAFTAVGGLVATIGAALRHGVRSRRIRSTSQTALVGSNPGCLATCHPGCSSQAFAARCSVQLRAYDEPDGPDSFFERKKTYQRAVVPAWNQHTSYSKVRMNEDFVFFFPQKNNKQDPSQNGWINPKMYKKRRLSRRLLARARRTRKRAWRQLSKKLQDEWRFRRFPRDESGKVVTGQFRKRSDPGYVGMR